MGNPHNEPCVPRLQSLALTPVSHELAYPAAANPDHDRKLTERWKADQRSFAERDLSGVDYVYPWADGIHVNIRLEERHCGADKARCTASTGRPAPVQNSRSASPR